VDIYIYTHTHTHTHTYVYTCIYRRRTEVPKWVYIYIHLSIYVYIHLSIHEQDASGLLPKHPYAVLRVEEVPVATASLASPREDPLLEIPGDTAQTHKNAGKAQPAARSRQLPPCRRLVQMKCVRTSVQWKATHSQKSCIE